MIDTSHCLQMGVTLSRLASVQRNLGKLDESIRSLEKAEKMFGHNDIYRAVILSKLGVSYRYKEDPKRGVHYAEKAETIINKDGNKDHPGKWSPITHSRRSIFKNSNMTLRLSEHFSIFLFDFLCAQVPSGNCDNVVLKNVQF